MFVNAKLYAAEAPRGLCNPQGGAQGFAPHPVIIHSAIHGSSRQTTIGRTGCVYHCSKIGV